MLSAEELTSRRAVIALSDSMHGFVSKCPNRQRSLTSRLRHFELQAHDDLEPRSQAEKGQPKLGCSRFGLQAEAEQEVLCQLESLAGMQ